MDSLSSAQLKTEFIQAQKHNPTVGIRKPVKMAELNQPISLAIGRGKRWSVRLKEVVVFHLRLFCSYRTQLHCSSYIIVRDVPAC